MNNQVPPFVFVKLEKEDIDKAIKDFVLKEHGQKVSEFGFVMEGGKVVGAFADLEKPKYIIGDVFTIKHPECETRMMKWSGTRNGDAILSRLEDSDPVNTLKVPIEVIISLTEPVIIYPDSFDNLKESS